MKVLAEDRHGQIVVCRNFRRYMGVRAPRCPRHCICWLRYVLRRLPRQVLKELTK